MSLLIRSMTDADLDAADAVTMAAYGVPSSRKRLARYLTLQPGGWMVVELEHSIVGVGGVTLYEHFATIGMIGVAPTAQRRGVGKALMYALLEWATNRGISTFLLDATDVGTALYTSLGFVEDARTLRFSGAQALKSARDTYHGQHEFISSVLRENDLAEVAGFDAAYFGSSREKILARYLKEYPERAFLLRGLDGKIGGYLVAQPNAIGPWVAVTPAAAELLLEATLTLSFSPFPGVNVYSHNPDAIHLLTRYGFVQDRSLSHMRLGPSVSHLRDLTKIYGQSSFALG